MITMQEYAARRQRILDNLGADAIVIIPSAGECQRSGDGHYPFRQHNNFYYLTGFNEPDALLVLAPGHSLGSFILFNRPKDAFQELWTGRRAGQEGACQHFGADSAYAIDEFCDLLPELLLNRKRVYYPIGRDMTVDELIMDSVNLLRSKVRSGVGVPEEFHNIEPMIHEMRLHKSAAEIAIMRNAANISVDAHKRAMQACKPGMFEYQLEAELLYEFCRRGCRSAAYSSIVGSGANACILHYTENNKRMEDGELVLIDAGGEYHNYASDITRTFPVNGKFSPEQKQLYELVLKSQLAAIAVIRPGLAWFDVQHTIIKVLVQGLLDLGILKGTFDDLIQQNTIRRFYMHNSGHWLGLDTHDAGFYKINDEWRLLESGFVLTVEPGLYIPAGSDDVDKKWWDIGIRIEDDVLVTDNGCDVLTADLPKSVESIESIMAEARSTI